MPLPPLAHFNVNDEILDVGLSARNYFHKVYAKEIKIGIAISIVFEALGLWLIVGSFMRGTLEDPRVIFILFLPAVAYFGALAVFKKKLRHIFYRQFASANGFSYLMTGWLEGLSGAIFSVGHSKKMEDIIEGNLSGVPISIFNYQYTVGGGKSAHTFQRTVWKVDFKTPVPSVILLVDSHMFGDNLSDNTIKLPGRINLGGDLESHFTLFCEKKFEIEALQIFSPEFLNLIFENYKQFSLDFSDTSLFIYSNRIITTKVELLKLNEFADLIVDRLSFKLPAISNSVKSMNEAFKKQPQGFLTSVSGTAAKIMGKPNASYYLVLGIVMLVFFALILTLIFIR